MPVKSKKRILKTKKRMVKGSTPVPPEKEAHKYFNLQKIIERTRIQPDKLYNNMKGAYNSLTQEECKQIATCLMVPVVNVFQRLGMTVTFSKAPETQDEINDRLDAGD